MKHCRHGFTFVELLVTLSIMAVLVTVAIPMIQITVQREHERELRHALAEIRDAIDAYKRAVEAGRVQTALGESGYPKSLDLLVEGVPDLRSPNKQPIFFLRRVPRDPFATDTQLNAAQTWGQRSYATPADDPKPGDDVYDVYSLSDKVGLNGVAYRLW